MLHELLRQTQSRRLLGEGPICLIMWNNEECSWKDHNVLQSSVRAPRWSLEWHMYIYLWKKVAFNMPIIICRNGFSFAGLSILPFFFLHHSRVCTRRTTKPSTINHFDMIFWWDDSPFFLSFGPFYSFNFRACTMNYERTPSTRTKHTKNIFPFFFGSMCTSPIIMSEPILSGAKSYRKNFSAPFQWAASPLTRDEEEKFFIF